MVTILFDRKKKLQVKREEIFFDKLLLWSSIEEEILYFIVFFFFLLFHSLCHIWTPKPVTWVYLVLNLGPGEWRSETEIRSIKWSDMEIEEKTLYLYFYVYMEYPNNTSNSLFYLYSTTWTCITSSLYHYNLPLYYSIVLYKLFYDFIVCSFIDLFIWLICSSIDLIILSISYIYLLSRTLRLET